jgi:hypothetical protein
MSAAGFDVVMAHTSLPYPVGCGNCNLNSTLFYEGFGPDLWDSFPDCLAD